MPKNKKIAKQKKILSALQEKLKTTDFKYLSVTLFIVFVTYSLTLFRPWLPFDERLIYKEDFFPTPQRFSEISEIIKTFILKSHILSSNIFFSSLSNLRINPGCFSLNVITAYLLKNNAVLYHFLQLFIHIFNTLLVYLIFRKFLSLFLNKTFLNITVSLFTLLLALHSASLEAVLLTTNWACIFTYSFCFLYIFYEITKAAERNYKITKAQALFTAITFLIVMFITEYAYTLPFILFFIVFSVNLRLLDAKSAFKASIKPVLPYIAGLFLYTIISISNEGSTLHNLFSTTSNQIKDSALAVFIERNLWLTPQLFIHFLKLLFFPKVLSIYQSNLVKLSDELISPYTIASTFFYLLFLILPVILFIVNSKKKHSFIYPLFYSFFFSAFPFLHILTPTYCLSADRYCYFPLFFLLLILLSLFQILATNLQTIKAGLSVLVVLLVVLSLRTIVRITEWNDPYRFYKSAVAIEKNPLYKAHRMTILASYTGQHGKQEEMEELLSKSLELLEKAKEKFTIKTKENPNQPITLKLYGLDFHSLLLKTAYIISYIKNDNYQEDQKKILSFLEPYFENNLNNLAINQLAFYGEVLLKARFFEKAKEVLEFAHKKFDYSEEIALKLGELYLEHLKEPEKAFQVLSHINKLYPNNSLVMRKLLKYYELKIDLAKQAEISYLIGLREHQEQAYQKAAQLYLELNQLDLAHKSLLKLARLKTDSPFTYLLAGKYLDLSGKKSQVIPVLNSALNASIKLGNNQDINITKSIIISLAKVHTNQGNIQEAKKYIKAFEKINGLKKEETAQINLIKQEVEKLERLNSASK